MRERRTSGFSTNRRLRSIERPTPIINSPNSISHSIRRLLSLPEHTRLFLCHDYKAPGRDDYRWETTVGEERRTSVHVHDGVDEEAFVAMREARDANLPVPKLLLPSIQVNIRAGRFAEAEANGVRYLKIPVKSKSFS